MHAYPSPLRANLTLAILILAYILSFIDRQILSLLVDPIRRDLDISDFQMSLVQGIAFGLFYAVLGIPLGRLADHHNRVRIISVGIFLWSVMTMLCGMARTYSVLFLVRIGVGVGEAALSPSAYSIFADSFPSYRLARVNSIYTLGIALGSGAAYIVGGAVIEVISEASGLTLPFVGHLKPWQATFIIVGAPGILISLIVGLVLREPARQGLAVGADGKATRMSFGEVMRFMAQRPGAFGSILGSISLMSIMGYGYHSWYPAFLMRTYGMSPGEAGLAFGSLFLVLGGAGAISGGFITEFMAKRGYRDANPRWLMLAALAVIPVSIGPLMPTSTAALFFVAPLVFIISCFTGTTVAALQLISPNQMRAVVAAILLLACNLIGLTFGASLVAILTDFVFQNDLALRYSLTVMTLIVAPLAALTSWKGLKSYRAALDDAKSWS